MQLLYICTHNRCRSILCEAITNHLAQGRIRARSAGSHPAGQVHPLTLEYLRERGILTEGLRSQSWDEVADPHPDAVITVCDSAAGETCPIWLGNCPKVHWGLPDPSRQSGPEQEVRAAFQAVMDTIEARVRALLRLPVEDLRGPALRDTLQSLAREY